MASSPFEFEVALMRRDDAMRRYVLRRNRARSLRPLVEGVEPRIMLTTFTVMNTTDTTAAGSLRWAIGQSNAASGSNVIDFQISGSGVHTIAITSALPTITIPVTIDGTSQPNYVSSPLIELDGAGAGAIVDGLDISAGSSTVKGLAINRFSAEGISLSGIGHDTIEQDFLGTDPTGTIAEGNGRDGLLVGTGSNNNSIVDNLISGNVQNGIYLSGSEAGGSNQSTSSNVIAGNLIGTDVTGTIGLGNEQDGVLVQNAPMTVIGGLTPADLNVISSNLSIGVRLNNFSDGTVVEGNYIGPDISGEAVPAAGTNNDVQPEGISLQGISNSTIGGTAAGSTNVISGNTNYGINSFVIGSGNIAIEGNLIGTDATGTAALGNTSAGVFIFGVSNVTIGGTASGDRNIISGNLGDGISTFGSGAGLMIEGNSIGVDINGDALGNGEDGINATFAGISIGGLQPGAGNIIANNGFLGPFGQSGIEVSAVDTSILSNSIYNDKNLGIANDEGSNAQTPPVLTSADSLETTGTIQGSVTGAAGTYTLQFFSNPGFNTSGNAEGETLLGTGSVTIVGTSATFSISVPNGFTPGSQITATATDPNGNTSAFSEPAQAFGVAPGSMPPTITPAGTGTTVSVGQDVTDTFTIANTSPDDDSGIGFADVIPAGTTFVSGTDSDGNALVLLDGTVTDTIGQLLTGQSLTVSVVLATTATAVPGFTDVGQVTATSPVVALGTDTASFMTTVTPSANLAVAIVGPTTATRVGQTLTYMVTATDKGPSPATGVVLTDTLPAGVTLVSAKANVGTVTTGSGPITDSVASLTDGSSVVLTITVIVTASSAASISDTAKVSANEADPDPTNNVAIIASPVTEDADVAITSDTASPSAVTVGQTVTFTIVVANNGPSAATGLVDATTLPAGLTFVSGTAVGGLVSNTNGVVTFSIGTLASGEDSVITIVATAAANGSYVESSTATAAQVDPVAANNTSTATVVVSPIADVSIVLGQPTGSFDVDATLTYTAVVTNNGPSAATNVTFTDTLFAGAAFVSVEANGVAGTASNGVVTLPIGTLASGASATVVLVVTPTEGGSVTDTATVAATETDPVPANNTSSVSSVLAIPPTIIVFDSASYSVAENAGFASITIDRTGYTQSAVQVHFSTYFGGNAVAGVDYIPTAMTVDFASGQTQATVAVPVLADPNDNHDELVNLELDTPTPGVYIGPQQTAVLTIVDIDPVLVGPRITNVKLTGPVSSITAVELDISGNLNPITATFAPNYTIVALGGGGSSGLAYGTVVPVVTAAYNPSNGAVVLIPSRPLPGNELFLIRVNGTTFGAVSDLAGNLLNSTIGVSAGSDFMITVARGTDLNYVDENGASVNLTLKGPGTLDIDRLVTGEVYQVQVVGAVAKQTVLSGSVHAKGHTTLGTILGLGEFGSFKVNLDTPAFYVTTTTYPNPLSLEDAPAEDTLIIPPVKTTSKNSKVKAKSTGKVKAESVKHPKATMAHALSVKHKR